MTPYFESQAETAAKFFAAVLFIFYAFGNGLAQSQSNPPKAQQKADVETV